MKSGGEVGRVGGREKVALRDERGRIERLGEVGEEGLGGGKAGIERELRVVRVGPNPRLVVCEYMELAERRRCLVNVGRAKKYLVGMRIVMREPVEEEEYERPWVYRGVAPRRKGRR